MYRLFFYLVAKYIILLMTTLTRKVIIETLIEKHGFSKTRSNKMMNILLEELRNALRRDHRLLIQNLGLFEVMEKKPRNGRNPATGKSMIIDGRKSILFRTSKALRKDMNVNRIDNIFEKFNQRDCMDGILISNVETMQEAVKKW